MNINTISADKTWKFSLKNIDDLNRMAKEFNSSVEAIEDVSILAEPVNAGGLTIPNSMAIHPMEGCDGDNNGNPGKLTLRRYKRFAGGGAGLIWAEAIAVAGEGRANPRQIWLNENTFDNFKSMIDMMHKTAAESMGADHKPVIVAQLTHSGRYSKPQGEAAPIIPQRDPYRDPLTPEPYPHTDRPSKIANDYPLLTDEYLDELQNKYVAAARLAFKAGFDAVDIKSCHGYLINELLASRNRPGKYGGSFENRTRFLLGVVDKIHAELGDDKQVCLRLGVYDAIPFPYGWGIDEKDFTKPDLTEPKKLIALLQERGVRLINLTIGNPYYNPHVGRPFNQSIKGAYEEPEHPMIGVTRILGLAGKLQQEFPEIAFVGSGYSWMRHLMGNVAAASKRNNISKIIGGGRMGFAYPDFPKDILQTGKMDPAKVCIGCSACTQLMRYGQTSGCVVRDSKLYGPILRLGRNSDKNNLMQRAADCLQCQEPTCQKGCPAGINIPDFISLFRDGKEKEAYEVIRKKNVLPEICAWLCPVEQQCQGHCLQNYLEETPLPIADIQRYLSKLANKNGWSKLRLPEKATGRNIAIIGAGPAGIAAAATLLEAGHSITVFDKSEKFGGMVRSVIPKERQLDSLEQEISAIFADVPEDRMKLRLGTGLGKNLSLDAIMAEGFDSAFIGLGLPQAISSSKQDLQGLTDAITFLEESKTAKDDSLSGKRVAVIGGGNTAMDAAVTAKRLGAQDVFVLYRRSFEEMPAWDAERNAAMSSGIHFMILTQQLAYNDDGNGKLTGITVCPVNLGPKDTSGRRKPIPADTSKYVIDMDLAIEAIGQQADSDIEKYLQGVECDRGTIQTKTDSFETTRANVYAGGDIVRGASTVVQAVADGMAAAREIISKL